MTTRRFVGNALCLLLLLSVPGRCAEESVAKVPMELRRNLPFVQVMVNGKGPFTFGIDTGAGGESLVAPDLIQKLGLPVTGETEVGDPSGRNPQKVRTINVDSLKLGDVEFKNVKAIELRPSRMQESTDGILGFVLFRDYLFTLDYLGQEVRLARGELAPDGDNQVIPFQSPHDVPTIELRVGTQALDAHLDSRGMGLSLPEKLTQGLRFVSAPVVIGRGRTVSNDFEIKGAQLASDIQLGGYTFSQPFVEINPVFPVANFGSIALRNFSVTFDQKNKLVRLVAKEKTIVIAPPQIRGPMPPPALPVPVEVSPKALNPN
jgi:hypothetical protein